ncbi:hypothetical protein M9458_011481, partial [Cirrhinus mrigala]
RSQEQKAAVFKKTWFLKILMLHHMIPVNLSRTFRTEHPMTRLCHLLPTLQALWVNQTADILEQVPMADADGPGPSKPPRQFTVEPDIVASTKKQPPSRPPPPSGAPPPRPPPPSRPSFSAKKSQEVMRPAGLE